MAFHIRNCVGIRDDRAFAVQWLACALPCRRFTPALADDGARLRAGVDRYSFTVRDLHPLLLAGLPAHSENLHIRYRGEPSGMSAIVNSGHRRSKKTGCAIASVVG